jgi:Uncharacterized protein containing a Zn-ribbon (DUF2116)
MGVFDEFRNLVPSELDNGAGTPIYLPAPRPCIECGAPLEPRRHKFCSRKCETNYKQATAARARMG